MAMVEMEDCRCDHPGDLSSLCWFGVRDGGLGSARAVPAAGPLLARVPGLPRRPAADAIRTGCGRCRIRGGLAEPCPAAARRHRQEPEHVRLRRARLLPAAHPRE